MCVCPSARRRAVMSRSLSEPERERLAAEIAGLQSLDVTRLKTRWRTLYGREAPARFSRELLIRAVAYRLQERALGGLKPATRRCSSGSPPMRIRGDRLNSHRC